MRHVSAQIQTAQKDEVFCWLLGWYVKGKQRRCRIRTEEDSSIQVTVDTYGHLVPGATICYLDRLDTLAQGLHEGTRPSARPVNNALPSPDEGRYVDRLDALAQTEQTSPRQSATPAQPREIAETAVPKLLK